MSQGLFRNVIAMSGAMAWQKRLRTNNIHEAKQLAQRINCSNESISDMINCLRAVRVDVGREL
jgi:predicted alpha/beta superfamily hydrolase